MTAKLRNFDYGTFSLVDTIKTLCSCFTCESIARADPGGFVEFGRTPLRDKEISGSNSCREGAEFGEVNRLG